MKEKDYNTWLQEAKDALDGYSAYQADLAEYYRKARENAKAEYLAEKEQLKKDTAQSQNQAVVDTMKTERDLDRTLASRGLAFSGENAQTNLDLNLDLRGRLADLENAAAEQDAALDADYNRLSNELTLAHAKDKTAAAEKEAQLKMDIASAMQKAEEAEKEAVSQEGNAEESPLPDMTGKSFSERVKLLGQYAKEQSAAKKEAAKYTPEISAKELAKQLVSAAGEEGVIGSIAHQEKLEALLGRLTEEHDLSNAYLRELMLNLRSLGYRPDYREDEAYGLEDLQNRSAEAYQSYYDRYYRLYRSAGYSAAESDELAGPKALFMQFVYLYANSKNREMFESAMKELGYRNEVEAFYKQIESDPNRYGLGSALSPS